MGLAHQEAPPAPTNLVDVFHAVDRELSQAWNIKLPAAIWAESDLQLFLGLLSKQVSERETVEVPVMQNAFIPGEGKGVRRPKCKDGSNFLLLRGKRKEKNWPLL